MTNIRYARSIRLFPKKTSIFESTVTPYLSKGFEMIKVFFLWWTPPATRWGFPNGTTNYADVVGEGCDNTTRSGTN